MADVSVIIPCYNGQTYIAQTIESVLSQTDVPKEILVVDDGSTDGSAAIVERYVSQSGGGVKLVRLKKNGGQSRARNAGIENSTGHLLAFLDADDLWLSGKLSAQVQALSEHPRAGLCHTGYERFGDLKQAGPVIQPVGNRCQGRCFEMMWTDNHVCTSSVLVRREAIPAEGFDPQISNSEDYPIWLRVLFRHEAVYLPQVYVRYRQHSEQISTLTPSRQRAWIDLGKLRALSELRSEMESAQAERLRVATLEDLENHAYDLYWHGDYTMADKAFGWLREYGRTVKTRHHMVAKVRGALQKT